MLFHQRHLLDTRRNRAALGGKLRLDQRLTLLNSFGLALQLVIFFELGRRIPTHDSIRRVRHRCIPLQLCALLALLDQTPAIVVRKMVIFEGARIGHGADLLLRLEGQALSGGHSSLLAVHLLKMGRKLDPRRSRCFLLRSFFIILLALLPLLEQLRRLMIDAP